MDKQNASTSVDDFSGVDVQQITEQKRLESLLLDDSDSIRDLERIATHNTQISRNGKKSYSSLLILLTLLFFVSLSGGIYLFSKNIYSKQPFTHQVNYYVSPKLPMPVRQNNSLTPVVALASTSAQTPSADLNTIP
ncbi:MAG: hypothetical protein KAG12_00910, partial [Desulfuromusa sp.]|nr:hypothetical protein [Desulfuromusa sp.]